MSKKPKIVACGVGGSSNLKKVDSILKHISMKVEDDIKEEDKRPLIKRLSPFAPYYPSAKELSKFIYGEVENTNSEEIDNRKKVRKQLIEIRYSDEPRGLQCEGCGTWSNDLEEVCYCDINGFPITIKEEMEKNAQNPDALASILCTECREERFK